MKLVNNTVDNIEIEGRVIPGSGDLTVDTGNRAAFAQSDLLIQKMAAGDVSVHDGVEVLSLASGIEHLAGYIPKKVGLEHVDEETGGLISSPRYAPPGWKQQLFEIEFKCSTLNSIHEKDRDNVDIGWSSLKFYKLDNGQEIEMVNPTQAELDLSCVRTDFLWMPGIDYMILSGQAAQIAAPLADVFLWVIGVDLDAAYGGPQFTFAEGGINLDYIAARSAVGMKGVAGTILYYDKVVDPVTKQETVIGDGKGSNRMRFICRHPAGNKHRLQAIFEIFRA